jgi:hypothetical protein
MKKLPLNEAVADLMTIEPHVESSSLVLDKFTLPDGRVAILRMELTTDEWETEDATVWKPNS